MRPNTKRAARLKRWERYIALAADAGAIAMNLRTQPTPLDWVGAGLRVLGLGMRVRAEHRTARAGNPWRYFDAPGLDKHWLEVPEEFRRLVVDNTTDVAIDEDWWDGSEEGSAVCLGKVGDEQVGWIVEGTNVVDGPYVRAARADETYRALGERIWKRVGARHCVNGTGGLALDALDAGAIMPTAQMRALEERLAKFVDQGIARSCLLVGPPGTGKSMAIRWLTRRLGVTSVRIDLAVLASLHGRYDQQAVAASLGTLLKLLRPEAMILDDLDRVDVGGELLAFLELAGRTCRLVLASANRPQRMMGASLRPGRFDEVVTFDKLDPDVLRELLGADDADLFERLGSLPAAYVAEFLKRRRVLGRELAVREIGELEARRTMVEGAREAKTDKDDDDDE
jgi:hypothetical protein